MPPDFIIAGAPKAGTTWLYSNLLKNPRIFLTKNKEPRYYSVEESDHLSFHGPGDDLWLDHFVQSKREYESLYSEATDSQLSGEASSDYLYKSETAARRIRSDAPDAHIIILLRDPAHRAYSNWLHHVRDGRETLPFMDAMNDESRRMEAGWAWSWHYGKRGCYAQQLEHFFNVFPSDQIFTVLYDELHRNPPGVLTRVSSFLGVDPVINSGVSDRQNQSSVARSAAHGMVQRLMSDRTASRVLIPSGVRARLKERLDRATLHSPAITEGDYLSLRRSYANDVRQVARITGLDISEWLE